MTVFSASSLRNSGISRVVFDPGNTLHVQSLEKFLNTGSWGWLQFHIEGPYVDVPSTVLNKFARAQINAN